MLKTETELCMSVVVVNLVIEKCSGNIYLFDVCSLTTDLLCWRRGVISHLKKSCKLTKLLRNVQKKSKNPIKKQNHIYFKQKSPGNFYYIRPSPYSMREIPFVVRAMA